VLSRGTYADVIDLHDGWLKISKARLWLEEEAGRRQKAGCGKGWPIVESDTPTMSLSVSNARYARRKCGDRRVHGPLCLSCRCRGIRFGAACGGGVFGGAICDRGSLEDRMPPCTDLRRRGFEVELTQTMRWFSTGFGKTSHRPDGSLRREPDWTASHSRASPAWGTGETDLCNCLSYKDRRQEASPRDLHILMYLICELTGVYHPLRAAGSFVFPSLLVARHRAQARMVFLGRLADRRSRTRLYKG